MNQSSIALAMGLALLVPQTFAATKTWNGSADDQWQTGGNWTPSGVPAAGDNVIIDNTAPGTGSSSTQAVLAASINVNTLTFDKSTDFALNGGGENGRRMGGSCIVTAKQARVYWLPQFNSIASDKIFDVVAGGVVRTTPGDSSDYGTLGVGQVIQKGRGTVWVQNHYGYTANWKFGAGAGDGGGTLDYTINNSVTVKVQGQGDVRAVGFGAGEAARLQLWPLSGYTGTVTAFGSTQPAQGGKNGILFTNDNNVLQNFNIKLDDSVGTSPPSIIECIRYAVSTNWAWTNMTLSGAGRVIVSSADGGEYWWRSNNKKLTLSGCTVAPRGTGRTIQLYTDVDFQKNGTTPTTLSITLSNSACDKVTVLTCHPDASVTPGPVSSGADPNRLANCALDLTVAPGIYTGMTFTNLTTSSDLSGGTHFFGSVNLHRAKATINYMNGKVTLTAVEAPKPTGAEVMIR